MKKLTSTFVLLSLAMAVAELATLADDRALASLAEVERAFAKMSVEMGQRAAFLAYFADDGIGFQPEPVKMKALLTARPPGPPFVLDWEPWTGDLAQAGDLGYTTGPWVRRREGTPATYGWYFTMWKRQPDGSWRVAADIGISSPSPGELRSRAFQPAAYRAVRPSRKMGDIRGAGEDLLRMDQALSERATRTTIADAFLAYAVDDVRLYRDGLAPMTSVSEVKAHLQARPARGRWEPLHADVAASGDLGYTYGSFEIDPIAAGGAKERGFYLRVWTRQAQGWRLACDVANGK